MLYLAKLPRCLISKESACQCRAHGRCEFSPRVGRIPWRRAWQPTLLFLPGESHEQKSLVGYSLPGHKQLDTTEQLTLLLKELKAIL